MSLILCANPAAQYEAYQEEIDAAIKNVLRKGHFILGEEVVAFEREFSDYLGIQHTIGVANGTDALHLALAACDIGPGDEVITVAHTAVATVSAILLAGAKPVFVDIDPVTFTLDPEKLAEVYTLKVKAIIAVHIYGQCVDLDGVMAFAKEKDLVVIEDCAQCHGAFYKGRRAGTWGDISCFSFYPTKNLGALGDGGAVATNSTALYEKISLLRQYGWKERFISLCFGWNSRLDEIQAAILRVKLRNLDEDNRKRQRIAEHYIQALSQTELVLPQTGKDRDHVFHLFVIRAQERALLIEQMDKQGIKCGVHYPMPIHKQPGYAEEFGEKVSLPETERAAKEILSLPMYPQLKHEEVDRVIMALVPVLSGC
jgi:dTDP-4-amino-4,6-dideoxygalactose transaminase